jgi:hypothetical protein
MITRRLLPLFLLLLALAVPAAADAAGNTRKVPKIFITLTDGAQNGKLINQPITASFPLPKGVAASAACKGKVAFSVPIGKKLVKKKKKTIYATKKASLKLILGSCSATSTLKLPEALLGKTLKFTAAFKGNDAIKKFSKSSKHLVALPAPAPTPPAVKPLIDLTKGPWTATQTPLSGASLQWTFTINPDNTVNSFYRSVALSVPCPSHGNATLNYLPIEEGAFQTPFKITANDMTATADWTGTGGEHSTSTFVLHFDSATHATGTFKLDGTLFAPSVIVAPADLVPNCSTGEIPVEFSAGGAV